MSIYKKLNEARKKFHSQPIKKTGRNNFAKYDYFELGDFLVPALNIFDEVGLCGVVRFGSEVASLTVVDLETNDTVVFESPMSTAQLKGCHEVQNLGAVQTYLRRYLWVMALEIVEHDAVDATTGQDKNAGKGVITPTQDAFDRIPSDQHDYIKELADDVNAHFNNGTMSEAVNHIERQSLDADQKTALWSLLDSKVRSAFKKTSSDLKGKTQ